MINQSLELDWWEVGNGVGQMTFRPSLCSLTEILMSSSCPDWSYLTHCSLKDRSSLSVPADLNNYYLLCKFCETLHFSCHHCLLPARPLFGPSPLCPETTVLTTNHSMSLYKHCVTFFSPSTSAGCLYMHTLRANESQIPDIYHHTWQHKVLIYGAYE